MAAGNQVVLTIAGESKPAEDAFRRVGSASRDMEREVDRSGDAFERARDRADDVDTKAMGFRDTLTGIQDGTEGIKRAASGDWGFETLLLLGFGIGDLASGLFNFLIPALKSTRIAQLGLNMAFLTSPLTWIILGIVALVAAFVILWKKSEAFRNFWKGAWDVIKRAASGAWDWIKNAASRTWEWLKKIPGWIRDKFASIADTVSRPFRSAFNFIADAWNNTIGRLSWTVPGWVPGIGGNTISVPHLPHFHSGGRVPGVPGTEVPIMAMAGEEVVPRGEAARGDTVHVTVKLDSDVLIEGTAREVRRRGGNVQLVLGGGNVA